MLGQQSLFILQFPPVNVFDFYLSKYYIRIHVCQKRTLLGLGSELQLSPQRSYLHPISAAGEGSPCLYATRHTLPFAVYSETLAFRLQFKLSLNNNICLGAILHSKLISLRVQSDNYFSLLIQNRSNFVLRIKITRCLNLKAIMRVQSDVLIMILFQKISSKKLARLNCNCVIRISLFCRPHRMCRSLTIYFQ